MRDIIRTPGRFLDGPNRLRRLISLRNAILTHWCQVLARLSGAGSWKLVPKSTNANYGDTTYEVVSTVVDANDPQYAEIPCEPQAQIVQLETVIAEYKAYQVEQVFSAKARKHGEYPGSKCKLI